MASEITIVVGAKDEASRTFRVVDQNSETMLGNMKRSWMGATAAITAGTLAIGGAVAGASKLVGVAASTDEAINKNTVIFKENADQVLQWAETSATSFGLARREALDASGTFGNMLTQLGIGTDQALGMSTAMVELAADFASFHNADITEVIQAQTAAFRGEYDAVQRYVPTINAAAVQQKALEMGLAETTKELTAQDKALATNALLMEGAGEAAGDFERTSDSLTNQQRILEAQLDDLQGNIGRTLIPAFTKGTAALNKLLDAHAEDVARGIASGIDAIARSLSDVGVVLDALRNSGPVRITFELFGKNIPNTDTSVGEAASDSFWTNLQGSTFGLPFTIWGAVADALRGPTDWSQSDLEAMGAGRPFEAGRDNPIGVNTYQKGGVRGNPHRTDWLPEWIEEFNRKNAALRESLESSGAAAAELTAAEERLLEQRDELLNTLLDIENDFLHEQIEAYLKGGQAQVDVVKRQQADMAKSAHEVAYDLMQTFGIDLPDALSIAMDSLKTDAEEMQRAIEETTRKIDELRYAAYQGDLSSAQIGAAVNSGTIGATEAQRLLLIQQASAALTAYGNGTLQPGMFDPAAIAQGIASGVFNQDVGSQILEALNAPAMAAGGIVRARSGGTLVRVGEAGRDEAIVPLDGRGYGGGLNVEVNVEVNGSIFTERELNGTIVRAVRDAIIGGGFRDVGLTAWAH
ncbi:MAG: hypothetical protein AB7F65_02870 [Dehalococcoidia bacterium]